MILQKAFDDINEVDLRQLIENKISERKTIEYKECLPDDKYESKKEFLADVSSFANTVGGYLLYGIREENGFPVTLRGIVSKDFDHETQRLENLLRDNVQPRLPGLSIRSVNIEGTDPIVIVHVPQSWSKPHVVNFQGHWRFYARNSVGKYPLDAIELRSAFLATTAIGERIRNFHFDRLSKIVSNEIAAPLAGTARLVFHVIPYSAFETKPQINLKPLEKDIWSLSLIYSSISSYRYNLDGLIAYNNKDNNSTGAYTQLYRNGIIESVSTTVFNSAEGNPYIPSIVFEQELIEALKTYISTHQKLLISPPAVLILSLTGVRGYKLAVSQRLEAWHNHIHVIDRDSLLLPETIIEDYAIHPAAILRPIFDAVWNSAGWPKSYGYDEDGEWGNGPNFRR